MAALDFGTTYSGFAFSTNDSSESSTTPTALLLTHKNEIVEFGYEAQKIFNMQVEKGNGSNFRFLDRFQMQLRKEQVSCVLYVFS